MNITRKEIGKGVFFSHIKTDKYKTGRISVNFVLPLDEKTATENTLVFAYLRMNCKRFESFSDLNRTLSDLYGAALYDDTAKMGDMQVLTVAASFLSGNVAPVGESISLDISKLLSDIIFCPKTENGEFLKEETDIQKENLREEILSELNDKRRYALRKAIGELFKGKPFAVSSAGSLEGINAATTETLNKRYEEILKTASVEIIYDGPDSTEEIEKIFTERFSNVNERTPIDRVNSAFSAGEIIRINEEMKVSQAKEVLVFTLPEENRAVLKVLCAVFGATPFSMLFKTVREKMSLCYYCSASFVRSKNIMIVESGVDNSKVKDAEKAICAELKKLCSGEFSDELLSDTKRYLCSLLKAVEDAPNAYSDKYLTSVVLSEGLNENEKAEIEAVSREDLMRAAEKTRLCEVYVLAGGKNDK